MQITKKKGALVVETLAARVINPINQKNPLHPDQTSVSVAGRCERQGWPVDA
jgi:hypothetical protein